MADTHLWRLIQTWMDGQIVRVNQSQLALEEHLEWFPPRGHGLVFASARGTPLTRGLLADAWRGGGGRGRGWHELRHHHASLLIAAGLSPRAVGERLGHSDYSETLRTYAHLWPSDEARILEAVEAAYGFGTDL